jgi:hypothetical protein
VFLFPSLLLCYLLEPFNETQVPITYCGTSLLSVVSGACSYSDFMTIMIIRLAPTHPLAVSAGAGGRHLVSHWRRVATEVDSAP